MIGLKLKAIQETDTGLNTKFVNTESNRTFGLEHVIQQIDNNNPNYRNYQHVHMKNGTDYVRSKPNSRTSDNIE